MELKKLYEDITVLIKREMPLPDFLFWCDMAARRLLAKYPKKLVLPKGEYVAPTSISGDIALDGEFKAAILYFVAGSYLGNEGYISESESAGEAAYLKLWRESAKGKRRKGDEW